MPTNRRTWVQTLGRILIIAAIVYLFLVSIKLMGGSFKLLGKDLAEQLLQVTADPFRGLLIGLVATALLQSSSTTTSLIVALVAAGGISLEGAIPMVMGANIGTSITNTIVSMGHIGRKQEFQQAFSGSIVHDIFNIMAVLILFPIEMTFHVIAKLATGLTGLLSGVGGLSLFDPIDAFIKPTSSAIIALIGSPTVLIPLSIVLLSGSLILLVRTMRRYVIDEISHLLNLHFFATDTRSFFSGLVTTITVQSSSVSTSLVVPLLGTNVLSINQIFPYTLGANVGTTMTALLAAFATLNPVAITVGCAHLIFNLLGIAIFYPLRAIPIRCAQVYASIVTHSRAHTITFVALYFIYIYLAPFTYVLAQQ